MGEFDFDVRLECAIVRAEIKFLASEMERIVSLVEDFDRYPTGAAAIADRLYEVGDCLPKLVNRVMAAEAAAFPD